MCVSMSVSVSVCVYACMVCLCRMCLCVCVCASLCRPLSLSLSLSVSSWDQRPPLDYNEQISEDLEIVASSPDPVVIIFTSGVSKIVKLAPA